MKARSPLLVGVVLLTAILSLTWFVLGTSKDRFGASSTYILYADFDDASGIRYKTRLQLNGIDIGRIDGIHHVRDDQGHYRARITLRVHRDYAIYADAVLRKAAESLLGDYRLDLDPGSPDQPRLAPGGNIRNVESLSDLEEIQSQLRKVATNVNQVTESFSHVLAGPEGEGSLKQILANVERSMQAIERTTQAFSNLVAHNDRVVSNLIGDIAAFSSALKTYVEPGGDVKVMTENLAQLSARLEKMANSVGALVDSSKEGEERQADLKQTVASIHESADHIQNITRKIDEGEGTLGRVINDAALVNKAESTLDDVGNLLGGLARLQLEVELRTQYEVPFARNDDLEASVKNILGLRVIPRPDKYYLFEAISDPRGYSKRQTIGITENGATTKWERNEIEFNKLKFSAQFAKRYYFLTLRFGIIENTGGFGANLYALNDLVELRLDSFDFNRYNPDNNRSINPRFRTTLMAGVENHLRIQVGIDDPFNHGLRTWFVGGILRFTDYDLKSIIGSFPFP